MVSDFLQKTSVPLLDSQPFYVFRMCAVPKTENTHVYSMGTSICIFKACCQHHYNTQIYGLATIQKEIELPYSLSKQQLQSALQWAGIIK